MIKYCLPIIEDSKEKVLTRISENPDYDFYEIWLAYTKDLDTDFVWKISEKFNGKLIFLFRKQNLEKTDLEKDLKEKIIKLLENSDNLLDLDIKDQKEELDFVRENKLGNKLIVSYHNYDKTPELEEIINEIEKFDFSIIKIACFCNEPEDSIKLLQILLKLKRGGKKYIVLGMGDQGKIVRIYGALWGNAMNFAPTNKDERSAPGQITKKQLEEILERIENAG